MTRLYLAVPASPVSCVSPERLFNSVGLVKIDAAGEASGVVFWTTVIFWTGSVSVLVCRLISCGIL